MHSCIFVSSCQTNLVFFPWLLTGTILCVFLLWLIQVLRDYDAFEKLQNEIIRQFSDLKLPSLPRKFHLFLSDSDIEERQISFDCLMTVLARNSEICTSIPVLQFLGIDLLADRKYHKRRKEYMQKQEQMKEEDRAREEQIIGHFKESEEDIFGEVVGASGGATLNAKQRGAQEDKQSATLGLFGDEEQGSPLFGGGESDGTVEPGMKAKGKRKCCF